MSKGYKREYIDKVKNKFNDVQSVGTINSNNVVKSSNDSRRKVCHTNRMDKLGK